MRDRKRRGLVVIIVLALGIGALVSYRSKTLADNERRFRDAYGD